MIIHDALSDYIICGDTNVFAHELRFVIDEMKKNDEARKGGFRNKISKCTCSSMMP